VIELAVVDVTARPIPEERRRRMREDIEARVRRDIEARGEQPGAVVGDMPSMEHHVRLKEKTGDRVLDIGIGQPESRAIALALRGERQPRPMTHDFIGNLLQALDDVSVLRVVITKRDTSDTSIEPMMMMAPASPPCGTFYAQLELQHRERTINVDCRPSDGIAVAVRLGIPVLAAPALDPEFKAA
jgi:bifunctional DNase/RNase